jgi:tetratricopeptide (TPR) repeat protein
MNRNRLSERDAALVAAEVGPRFPATSTLAEHLAAWERAVDLAPEQADRWYELADTYFHEGSYLQIPSTHRRAAEAFRRSAAIDSNTAALGHLLEVAVLDHDTAEVRRLGPVYVARDSSGELHNFYRWRIAEGLGDERALAALRAEYGRMPLQSLWRIMNHAVLDGRRLDDADAAAQAIRAVSGRGSDWQRSKTYLHAFEINRGRPAAALGDTARLGEAEYGPHAALYERVLDALYGDGDAANADAASRELAIAARTGADSVAQTDVCVSTLWRTSRGDVAGAAEAIARLRRGAPGDSPATRTTSGVCAALLEAKAAVASRATDARVAVERLDSLMRDGPSGQRNGPAVAFTLSAAYVRSTVGISPVGFEDFANTEVARMYERLGDVRAALAAARRRSYSYHLSDYFAAQLREEGHLASLTGDRAGAARAYRHYLALRSVAEASLRPRVDSVRAELARLDAKR